MSRDKLGLFTIIRSFLNDHLITLRRSSPHTLRSNRTLLRMFVRFMSKECGVKLGELSLAHITAEHVKSFITWMIEQNGNSESTANLRLALIKNFCSFVISKDPLYADKMMEIKQIKKLRKVVEPVGFLEEEEIAKLISLPDTKTRKGLRDRLLIMLMFETGARLTEAANLRYSDFSSDKDSCQCHLFGKGKKHRLVPVSSKLLQHVELYRKMLGAEPGMHVFTSPSRPNKPLSSSAIYKIITTYGAMLSEATGGKVKGVHPHMLRHSMAMHLYRNGTPLDMVSQLLGHSSVETTMIYAFADTEMKRNAIESTLDQIVPDSADDDQSDLWSDEKKLFKLASLE